MSDYELIDVLVRVLDQLSTYTENDFKELYDIAKDHLTDSEYKLLKEYLNSRSKL